MHQELNAHGLPRIRCHVQRLLYPRLVVSTLVEDRLQDGTGGVGDISILPVKRDAVGGAGPIPEAQRTSTCSDCDLLIEDAIPCGLDPGKTAKAIGRVARESGKSTAVRLVGADYGRVRAASYPACEVTGLESTVNDHFTRRAGGSRCRSCPAAYRPVNPPNLVRPTCGGNTDWFSHPSRATTEGTARVPECRSIISLHRPIGPTPFTVRHKGHVGLDLDPISAGSKDGSRAERYRKCRADLRDCGV